MSQVRTLLRDSQTIPKIDVAEYAREFVGARWSHQGRCLGKTPSTSTVDCIGLPLLVAHKYIDFDMKSISGPYFRNTEGRKLLGFCREHMDVIKRPWLANVCNKVPTDNLDIADVVVLALQKYPLHMGIIVNSNSREHPFNIVHAFGNGRGRIKGKKYDGVIEHSLDKEWLNKIVEVFRYRFVAS